MKNLNYITIRTVELATYARNAFKSERSEITYEYLDELLDFLDDHVGSREKEKCESAEPSILTADISVLNSDPEKCESAEP